MKLSGWYKVINNLLRLSLLICVFLPGVAPADELSELRGSLRESLVTRTASSSSGPGAESVSTDTAALIGYLSAQPEVPADPALRRRVEQLSVAYLQLLDPVWGGVYLSVESSGAQRSIDPQKRLSSQAAALTVFAAAYQATREQRYANAIASVDEYLQEWLAAPGGGFFVAQLTRPERLPEHITAARYWSLRSEHERRRFGIPGVEEAVPSSANAQLISGYVRAFEATGEANYLRVAMRLATLLLDSRLQPEGWLREFSDPSAAAPLRTQALLGRALLDLFQTTAQPSWLQAAESLADALVAIDIEPGSFRGLIATAEYLNRLSRYSGQARWSSAGRRYLDAAIEQSGEWTAAADQAVLGITIESFVSGYVELLIAGDPRSAAWPALHAAALTAYQPRKLVMPDPRPQTPGNAQPALFVCLATGCRAPVTEVSELALALEAIEELSPGQ